MTCPRTNLPGMTRSTWAHGTPTNRPHLTPTSRPPASRGAAMRACGMNRESLVTGVGAPLEMAVPGMALGGQTRGLHPGTPLSHLTNGVISQISLHGASGSRPFLHACRDRHTSEGHSHHTSSPLPLTSPLLHTTLAVFLHASYRTTFLPDTHTTGHRSPLIVSTTPRTFPETCRDLLHTIIPTSGYLLGVWPVSVLLGVGASTQTLAHLLMVSTVTPHTCAIASP